MIAVRYTLLAKKSQPYLTNFFAEGENLDRREFKVDKN